MAETDVGQHVAHAAAAGAKAATRSASLAASPAHGLRARREPAVDERRQRAIGRIRAKRGFWIHLGVYVAVNALLVIVWAVASAGSFWPAWPMLGWGIGVVAHAGRVFIGSSEISEEQIERELQKRA